jgi:hypothetical protein
MSDLDEVVEVIFEVGELHWEIVTCLLDVLKCDFVELDERILQDVERPCELIFRILGIQIASWTKLLKVCFK